MPHTIDFPLRGEWKAFHIPGHHRHAFDFVGLDEHRRYCKGSSLLNLIWSGRVEDWYGWGRPVFSPVEGVVEQTGDGWEDRHKFGFVAGLLAFFVARRTPSKNGDDPRSVAGNFVTIRTPDALVFMCHLQNGSVAVKPGDRVHVGDRLGSVGNSGNSFAPHLHLNLFENVSEPLNGPSILRLIRSEHVPAVAFRAFSKFARGSWVELRDAMPAKGDVLRR